MTRRVALAVATAALVAGAAPLAGQTLRGITTEAGSERPVAGAALRLLAADSQAVASSLSDDAGRFQLTAPAGQYTVMVERIGFAAASFGPFRLRTNGLIDVTLELTPEAIPLDSVGVEVEARVPALELTGFYERRRITHGTFMLREEIEQTRALNIGRLLERVQSVSIVTRGNVKDVEIRNSGSGGLRPCLPSVYVSGALVAPAGRPFGTFDPDGILTDDIEAIEVYSNPATMPSQYATGSTCGVILVWLRK